MGQSTEIEARTLTASSGKCIYYRDNNNDPYKGGSVDAVVDGTDTTYADACDPQLSSDLLEIWCDESNNAMMTRYRCSLGCDGAGTPNQYCKLAEGSFLARNFREIITCSFNK